MTLQEAENLAKILRKKFQAEVDFEKVNDKGRYRFAVVSEQFRGVPHLTRQDQIWKVVDEAISREATMGISLILAFDPSDIAVDPA